jgi:3'-phosphoadenosine 5'-phosphosulfate sulfotransferase (PAPS reductase)/FAD synthetase
MSNLITKETLERRQNWTLERKIDESIARIVEWYEAWDGAVYVAFSGGLDSTVLRDIVSGIYPDVPAVFCNSGLEYPEITTFVKTIPGVEVIRPVMPFRKVIEKWGYPVVSKRVAQYIHEVRNAKGETATKKLRLTGIKSNGEFSSVSMIPRKWQYLCDAPFKVSHKCCLEIKKKPLDAYVKRTGRRPFVGTLADEGQQRTQTYYRYGCNAFDIRRPRSAPLSFWRHSDILEYINSRGIPYSRIYDMGHDQTGCMFCMFGVHLDFKKTGTNRFMQMKETHPKHWNYCINRLGLGAVMDYIGVPYEDKQIKMFATQ